jgi:hypothetical protein
MVLSVAEEKGVTALPPLFLRLSHPKDFLFFPQPVNIQHTRTPANPFLSDAYFTVLCIRTFLLILSISGLSLHTARPAISSLFSGPAHPTEADHFH